MPEEVSTQIPFQGILKLGSRGNQPRGVKRALARAGYGKLGTKATAAPIFGAVAVRNLKKFQKAAGLKSDGVYGVVTHKKLTPYFDAYARKLYLAPPTPPTAALMIPVTFVPTHDTAGLPGYPAVDLFAKPGTRVLAPQGGGTVRRLSGKDPAQGGVPGGSYGWSIYLATQSGDYYLTHFATRAVTQGQSVKGGELLGTVCDAKVAGMDTRLSHIHCGKAGL